jgi:hypothetical protein
LEPNFSGESGSKIWQNLLEMTKQHLAEKRQEFVVQLTVVARKILVSRKIISWTKHIYFYSGSKNETETSTVCSVAS